MDSAVSSRSVISSGVSGSIPRRSLERRLDGRQRGPLQDPDLVGAVGLLEHHLDDLPVGRRDALADVVGLDRELAVPAVDQDGEADRPRAAEVDDAVERRPDRPPGVEHVVAQQDRAAVQVEVDLGLLQQGLRRDGREVVAVERDVQGADREVLLDQVREPGRQAGGQRDAPGPDADQGQLREVLLALGDLVRHAVDHAPNAIGVEDLGLLDQLFASNPRESMGSDSAPSRNAPEKPLRRRETALKWASQQANAHGHLQRSHARADGQDRLLRTRALREDDEPQGPPRPPRARHGRQAPEPPDADRPDDLLRPAAGRARGHQGLQDPLPAGDGARARPRSTRRGGSC